MKKISMCLVIVISMCTIITLAVKSITYFAKSVELEATAEELRGEIAMVDAGQKAYVIGVTISNIQQRIWDLERKHDEKPIQDWNNPEDVEEYKRLILQKQELEEKQDKLLEKVDNT